MNSIGYVIERFYTACYLLAQCIPLEKKFNLPPPTHHRSTQPLSVTSVVLPPFHVESFLCCNRSRPCGVSLELPAGQPQR